MGVPLEVSKALNAQAGEFTPTTNVVPLPAEDNSTSVLGLPEWVPVLGTKKKGAVPRQVMEGAAGALEKISEAGSGIINNEFGSLGPIAPMLSAGRAFLPRRWIDGIYNRMAEVGMIPAENEIAADRTNYIRDRFVGDEPVKPSGPLNEALAPAIRGAGAALAMPFGPPSAAKNIIGGMGAGEAGDLLAKGGSAIGRHAAELLNDRVIDNPANKLDPEAAGQLGEEVGGLAGGMLGYNVNNIKTNVLTEGAASAANKVKQLKEAYNVAREEQQQGDKRFVTSIMADKLQSDKLNKAAQNFVTQQVNEQVAATLREDPKSIEDFKAFQKAAEETGIDTTNFTTAQKTTNPTLVPLETEYRPADAAERTINAKRREGQVSELKGAWDRLTSKLPLDDKTGVETAFAKLQAEYNLLGNAADNISKTIQNNVRALELPEKEAAGAAIRDAFDAEKAASTASFQQRYAALDEAAKAAGVEFPDLSGVLGKHAEIVNKTSSILNPTEVAPSMRNLFDMLNVQQNTGTPATFGQIREAVKSLNQDITSATDPTKAFNLTEIKNQLTKAIDELPNKDISGTYKQIQSDYANIHVPRFLTGENFNLSREGGINKRNAELRPNENVGEAYLTAGGKTSVTAMNQFNDLFGGTKTGGAPVVSAYKNLAVFLDDRYNRTVLKKDPNNLSAPGEITALAHDNFMRDHAPVIDSIEAVLPGYRAKLNKVADLTIEQQDHKQMLLDEYKEVANSPLTSAFGPKDATRLLKETLPDPRKVGQLMRTLGDDKLPDLLKEIWLKADPFKQNEAGRIQLDPEALRNMLSVGKTQQNSVGSLQTIFRKVMGKDEGDAHYKRLQDISLLMDRQILTEPLNDRPDTVFQQDPKIGGQSFASWLSQANSFFQGRQGAAHTLGIAGGRLVNAEFQKAAAAATKQALYDPATSKAVLEMAQTPAGQPISSKAGQALAKAGGEAGKSLVARLTDAGYIRRSLVMGDVISNTQEDERKNKNGKR